MKWLFDQITDQTTLSENQSKFPRYNMKCRGKHDTTVHEIFRVVSRLPRNISCYTVYRGKSISFGTVQPPRAN